MSQSAGTDGTDSRVLPRTDSTVYTGESGDTRLICPEVDSSVHISVNPDDPTICTAVFDRTASRKVLVEDFSAAIRKLDPPPPYREVDPRIFQAVRLLRQEKLTYEQASVQVFGSGNQAENIRYWDNWYRQVRQNALQEAKA